MTSITRQGAMIEIEKIGPGGNNFASWERGIKRAVSAMPRLMMAFQDGYPDVDADESYTQDKTILDPMSSMDAEQLRSRINMNAKAREQLRLDRLAASDLVRRSVPISETVHRDPEFNRMCQAGEFLGMIERVLKVMVGSKRQAMADGYENKLRNLQFPDDGSLATFETYVYETYTAWERLRLAKPSSASIESITLSYLDALPTEYMTHKQSVAVPLQGLVSSFVPSTQFPVHVHVHVL